MCFDGVARIFAPGIRVWIETTRIDPEMQKLLGFRTRIEQVGAHSRPRYFLIHRQLRLPWIFADPNGPIPTVPAATTLESPVREGDEKDWV